MAELREYQHEAIQSLRRSLAGGHKAPLLVAPTGSGKTAIAGEMIRRARERCHQVLFLAPRRELVYQVQQRLDSLSLFYGTIMAGEDPSLLPGIQVASIDTLHARAVRRDKIPLPPAGLVIVDEAHVGVGGQAQQIIDEYRKGGSVVVGLTATPCRYDGRGLGMIYDAIVQGPTVESLTELGWLVPARYFRGEAPDDEGLDVRDGEYVASQVESRHDTQELVGKVVDNWLRLASDRPTFAYAAGVKHSRHLCEEFCKRGVKAEHIDGQTETEERKAIQQRLRDGETQVLCNVLVLTYGVDFPPVSCIVLATFTKSLAKYLQTVGRGLRTYPGKRDCLVLDHGQITRDLGFADDPQPWSLDGKERIQERKERESTEPQPIECYHCGEVFKPAAKCPSCGADMSAKAKQAIAERDARLEEIECDKAKREGRQFTLEDKARWWAELRGHANNKGYKEGWAVKAYEAKFGCLPWPVYKTPPREPASDDVRGFIKHLQIRNAKRRAS